MTLTPELRALLVRHFAAALAAGWSRQKDETAGRRGQPDVHDDEDRERRTTQIQIAQDLERHYTTRRRAT